MGEDTSKPTIDGLRQLLRQIERKADVARPPEGPVVSLESAVRGRIVETPSGALYVIEEDAGDFLTADDDFVDVTDLFFRRGQTNREFLAKVDEKLADIAGLPPERILFLDIETAGFHGTALFLVGLLLFEGGRFKITQLFARDYAEEVSVLEELREYYTRSDVVVTFNGRAFDLPFIADRAIVHRVELERPEFDVDLLHAARRIWRGVLPNCRLGTLEEFVCGRRRTGDLPSHLIPQAYHDFVQTGDARLMVEVVRHNAYDLVTMAHLLAKMANA